MSKFLDHIKLIFDIFLISFLYIGGVFTLNNETIRILATIGAGISGAIVLAYFRRERNTKEIFFKTACAAMCGLVVGAVITKRWEIIDLENIIGINFFSSLLSFFLIKGLLNVTEQNASGFIITVLQKFLPQNRTIGNDGRLDNAGLINGNKEQIFKTDVIIKPDGALKTIETETEKEKI